MNASSTWLRSRHGPRMRRLEMTYGMFPVTYFNADASLKAWVPIWPGRDAAQYWGNLAGDFAWTVEPTLLIAVPFLIERAVASAASAAKKNA